MSRTVAMWQWRSKLGPAGWMSGCASVEDPGELHEQYEKRPLYADDPHHLSVPPEEYAELVDAARKLASLEAFGVDNWEGYSLAMEEFYGGEGL